MRTQVPGRLEGEFDDGTVVRFWPRDGKHRFERVGEGAIFSLPSLAPGHILKKETSAISSKVRRDPRGT